MDSADVLKAVKEVEKSVTRLNEVLGNTGISVEVGRLYHIKWGEPYEVTVHVSCDTLCQLGQPTWYPIDGGFVGEVKLENVKFMGVDLLSFPERWAVNADKPATTCA